MSAKYKLTMGFALFCVAWLVTGPFPLGGRELGIDCELYGDLTVHEQPAAVGTVVEALANGDFLADTTVHDAGSYSILIPPDDPATSAHDGWSRDDRITLLVNGEEARPSIGAVGGRHEADLQVPPESPLRTSTWAKIKVLFQ